jgi:predicted dehydrogenase
VTIRRNRALRGAIVGFGNVAVEGHLPAWKGNRHFTMLAVCDPDQARLAAAEKLLPDARRYTDLNDMLDQERLDFVDIAAPPATHTSIITEALARKVNVLCEKPLATRIEDCNRIRSAASAARAVVFTTHNWKYAPIFRTAKRTLRLGEIGPVVSLEMQTLRVEPPGSVAGEATWRLDPAVAGGGILVDHGWHAFYLALYLLDREPVAVSAETARRKFTTCAVEDTARCTIEFAGARAEIFVTWAAEERRSGLRLTGQQGTIDVGDRKLVVNVTGRAPTETSFAQPLSAGSYHPDWFATMLDDFREELCEPALRGTNFREAETCCRLLDLCYRSSEAGGISLPLHEPIPPPETSDSSSGG